MAKRYELSDEAWVVVSDLFIGIHGARCPALLGYPVRVIGLPPAAAHTHTSDSN